MSNKWNNIIREKLESHEVPADHLWNNISQNIPQSSSSFWKPWMTTAAIGTASIATSANATRRGTGSLADARIHA
jgi:hypothetical protein